MALADDITADDLKVFLQEVESLLELLDEDIIRLEHEAGDEELLQEIFRAAHTLKGSSGMLGFAEMASLTHAMEDLLDRVRKGTQPVTPELIDVLLMSLDGLKVLRDNLVSGQDATLDVGPMVEQLRAIAQGTVATVAAPAPGVGKLAAEPAVAARLQAAEVAGQSAYVVTVTLDPQSDWAAVRCFQVLNDLSVHGEVIASVPSQHEIEEERAGHTLSVLIATTLEPEAISPGIRAVADVIGVVIEPWTDESESGGDAGVWRHCQAGHVAVDPYRRRSVGPAHEHGGRAGDRSHAHRADFAHAVRSVQRGRAGSFALRDRDAFRARNRRVARGDDARAHAPSGAALQQVPASGARSGA
ncbi:MAG: hypothetical protein DWI58_02625 [Chloroflexi bacterium]|nr:MAG: hypothetical protein DWI58_02625 [Chloroflexota bacterium]